MAGVDVMWTFSVQGFSIPSHKLAQCEKGAPSLNPPACMICGTVRTCLRIAQKKHANSVGGRGISAFSDVFYSVSLIRLLLCLIDMHLIVQFANQKKKRLTRAAFQFTSSISNHDSSIIHILYQFHF